MKAIIQKVTKASVTVEGEVISSIGEGLCVLIGISRNDNPKDREFIVRKLLNLRLFDDDEGNRWKLSVKDKNLEILCVSQFTLQCVLKGNKPDFHQAMTADDSKLFYDQTLHELAQAYNPTKIKNGKFGAMMEVNIANNGPVTIELNSPQTQQIQAKTNAGGDKKDKKKTTAPTSTNNQQQSAASGEAAAN